MNDTALSELGNDRIAMGGNMSPFDAHKTNVDDLFEEAQVWLSGEGIASEAEATAVEQLLDLAREAKKAADEARKLENEPFDTGKAAVQAKYNPVLKRADTIADTCKQVLAPWRQKIADAKAAKAEAARLDAERIRKEAEDAIRSSAGNVAERERAEEKLALSKEADRFARQTSKAAVTGNGLRTSYMPVMIDMTAAIKHYWAKDPEAFGRMVLDMAITEVRSGAREIPGFRVDEIKGAI